MRKTLSIEINACLIMKHIKQKQVRWMDMKRWAHKAI